MTSSKQPDFANAGQVFGRALRAYKAKRPRSNLLKCAWVLVHETSPQYQQTLESGALLTMDGFALARGGRRSGWADRFPKDAIVCVINIGDSQRAFPVDPRHLGLDVDERVEGEHVEGKVLDALRAIFDGAPEAERPTLLGGSGRGDPP